MPTEPSTPGRRSTSRSRWVVALNSGSVEAGPALAGSGPARWCRSAGSGWCCPCTGPTIPAVSGVGPGRAEPLGDVPQSARVQGCAVRTVRSRRVRSAGRCGAECVRTRSRIGCAAGPGSAVRARCVGLRRGRSGGVSGCGAELLRVCGALCGRRVLTVSAGSVAGGRASGSGRRPGVLRRTARGCAVPGRDRGPRSDLISTARRMLQRVTGVGRAGSWLVCRSRPRRLVSFVGRGRLEPRGPVSFARGGRWLAG